MDGQGVEGCVDLFNVVASSIENTIYTFPTTPPRANPTHLSSKL